MNYSAASALGHIGPTAAAAVPALIGLLKDPDPAPDPDMRLAAILALGRIGDAAADAAPALIGLLKSPDPDPCVRLAVILALGHIGNADAVALNVVALTDPNQNVRIAAEAVVVGSRSQMG
jgi:HEAT repeat protein